MPARDLDVPPKARPLSDRLVTKPELFAPGVNDGLGPLGRELGPQGRKVAHHARIDRRQLSVDSNLDQTEFRTVRVFRDKLGVEGNDTGVGQPPTQFMKLAVGGEQFVFHVGSG